MRADHYLPLAQRLLKAAAVLGAVCWTVGALLTYAGARSFALAAGYGDVRAWLFPVTLDAVALVAYLALLMLPAGERWYPLLVVALCAGASAAAQGYHQALVSPGEDTVALGHALSPWVRGLAGAWPAVAALLAGHLLWTIVSQAIPRGLVEALRSLATVDQVAVDTEATVVAAAARIPVSRPIASADTVLGDTRDTDTAVMSPTDTGPRDTDTAPVSPAVPDEPLRLLPAPARRRVGVAVEVPDQLLHEVAAGRLSAAEAAQRAGVSAKTIRRRLEYRAEAAA